MQNYPSFISWCCRLLLTAINRSIINQNEFLQTLRRCYLEWVLTGQSKPILIELPKFFVYRAVEGPMLLVTMLFFSSLAFTILENAMSVIFIHRVAIHRRHFLVTAILPF
jgi:hypothetical protein